MHHDAHLAERLLRRRLAAQARSTDRLAELKLRRYKSLTRPPVWFHIRVYQVCAGTRGDSVAVVCFSFGPVPESLEFLF